MGTLANGGTVTLSYSSSEPDGTWLKPALS